MASAAHLIFTVWYACVLLVADAGQTMGGTASLSRWMNVSSGIPKLRAKAKQSKGRLRGPYAVNSEDSNKIGDERQVQKIAVCSESFAAPEKAFIECPQECPLMRFDAEMLCHWKCISEDQCHSYSGVVNHETLHCTVCAVAGCAECGDSFDVCRTCMPGFDLENGTCLHWARWVWMPVTAGVGVLALFVLVYAVCMALRPVVSQEVLDDALEYRSRTKARDDSAYHRLCSYSTNLCDTFTASGGIGTLLHFAWQRAMIMWGIFVLLIMSFATMWYNRIEARELLVAKPHHDEAHGTCVDAQEELESRSHAAMEVFFMWATGVVYVTSSVGAIYWAFRQRLKFARYDETSYDMQDYALLCSGLPKEGESAQRRAEGYRIEDEYASFFRSAWGDSVLGVSMLWDIAEKKDEVTAAVAKELYRMEGESSIVYKTSLSPRHLARDPGEAAPPKMKSRLGCLLDPYMRCLDGMWWGESEYDADNESPHPNVEVVPETVLDLLSSLETTGYVYVVFRTESDKVAALGTPLPKFRDMHDITVQRTKGNAEVVIWDAFDATTKDRVRAIVSGVFIMIITIAIWTVVFWGPYTFYILSWQETAGASSGTFLGGTLLGLVIAIGNQVVYAMCGVVSVRVKFTCRDHRDVFYTTLYTVAVLVNTVLDLWLVHEMALGWRRDASVDPYALVRNPSMQHALFVQLVFYLWPCTLLVPFLFEPVVTLVAPYYLGTWLVRSKPGIAPWEAEQCLAPPPFDLNRYGDILINVTLVTLFFFLTDVKLWWIFFMLVFSNILIFAWDDYRFKRGSQRTHFATQNSEILSQYVTVIPCAVLAAAFTFKYLGGHGLVKTWDDGDHYFAGHANVWLKISAVFVAHVVLHCFMLAVVLPRCLAARQVSTEIDEVPYEQAAEKIACNWFNGNPVHCLRSLYVYRHQPPHVFYMPGKEHLHRKNTDPKQENALIIYEASDFEKEDTLLTAIQSQNYSSQALFSAGTPAHVWTLES